MPYPSPSDPDYCAGSNQPCEDWDNEHEWFRCPKCNRLLKPRPKAHTFFPHVSDRRRAVQDDVRENLDAHGMNKVVPTPEPVYAEPESEST